MKMLNYDTRNVDAFDNRLLMGCGISQNLFPAQNTTIKQCLPINRHIHKK